MAKRVKLGFIGCGGFARSMHIPNASSNDKIQVYAACDTDLGAAEEARGLGRAKYATSDVDLLLGDPQVDAVVIATRHDSHAELTIRAAKHGKHVLCEKPMGLDADQCYRVARAVRDAGIIYTVGYNRGMAPLVAMAKELMAQDASRKLIYHRIQAPFPPSHWIHDRRLGGGRFVGEGCHIFDMLCELVGAPPTDVYASGGTFLDPAKVPTVDSGIVTLTFRDGSVGTTLIASDGCGGFAKESTEIYWAGKAIHIDNFQRMSYHGVIDQGQGEVSLAAVDKGHRRELDSFASAILHSAPPPNGVPNALRAAFLSFLAVESAETGRPLTIHEAEYTEW